MSDDDLLVFAAETADEPERPTRNWKIAVVDDDPAVHDATRFALFDYTLAGQGLEIHSAHSAAEARELLRRIPDFAVVLLDVVMESETAGLDLVEFIRHDLHNDLVRIILRTGQPGQAPERRVIVEHDINDYKAKTELTADKLFTALTAAIRSHQQLLRMEETRRGLEIIIDAATALFDTRSMQRFAEGVLTQVGSLLEVDCAGMLVVRDRPTASGGGELAVIAGSGVYSSITAAADGDALDRETRDEIDAAFASRRHCFFDRRSVLYIHTSSGCEIAVVLDVAKHLSATDRALVEVFCGKLSVAFENVLLLEQLRAANVELEQRVEARTHELSEANRRLADQRETLRRANAFKVELLGMVAHDLKNPIAAILGRAEILGELLDRPGVDLARIRTEVAKISAPAIAMNRMIGDLVGQAAADVLEIAIRPVPLDLTDLVHDVVDHLRPLAGRKDQTIVWRGDTPVRVVGDPDRLRDAVENVVSNAVKYGPIGGVTEVVVRPIADRAVVTVTDQGPGLSPEDFGRLFGRFQRLSAQPTGGEGSTGLGLSIAHEIIRLHDGHIGALNAAPGPGAVFEIVLPAVDPAGSAAQEPP
jgi:signal transduction histidine kinase/CheY-like chemotaxis protein